MLCNLDYELAAVISLSVDGSINFWKITLSELNINYGTDDLSNLTDILICHY
jgi:hypothetical protein